jgi:nucleoid-associated protein YgaU
MFVKTLLIPETGFPWMVQFNPKELSLKKTVPWEAQAAQGKDVPEQQFNTGQARTLTFELFFDRYEQRLPVHLECGMIEKMAMINEELHRPPIVRFIWGSFFFKGVFKEVSTRYTMFVGLLGMPCRATMNITMVECEDASAKLGSPDHAKLRRLKRGETLHTIAATEYDDAAQWRRIAEANGIENPMDLEPGQELLIPPILNFTS